MCKYNQEKNITITVKKTYKFIKTNNQYIKQIIDTNSNKMYYLS
jgi:hypothetical protein